MINEFWITIDFNGKFCMWKCDNKHNLPKKNIFYWTQQDNNNNYCLPVLSQEHTPKMFFDYVKKNNISFDNNKPHYIKLIIYSDLYCEDELEKSTY